MIRLDLNEMPNKEKNERIMIRLNETLHNHKYIEK